MSDFKKIEDLEKRLWSTADQLRANTGLTAYQYSQPVLGLIFLRYAEYRFELAKEKLENKQSSRRRGAGNIKSAIQAEGAMYVPDAALFSNLLQLSEGEDLGKVINDVMKALEAENEASKVAGDELSIFGQEKTSDTVCLAKMNLAVHGLQGNIRESNSYYEDIHNSAGHFGFVMANPPFNVDAIQKERLEDDKARFPFGMQRDFLLPMLLSGEINLVEQ